MFLHLIFLFLVPVSLSSSSDRQFESSPDSPFTIVPFARSPYQSINVSALLSSTFFSLKTQDFADFEWVLFCAVSDDVVVPNDFTRAFSDAVDFVNRNDQFRGTGVISCMIEKIRHRNSLVASSKSSPFGSQSFHMVAAHHPIPAYVFAVKTIHLLSPCVLEMVVSSVEFQKGKRIISSSTKEGGKEGKCPFSVAIMEHVVVKVLERNEGGGNAEGKEVKTADKTEEKKDGKRGNRNVEENDEDEEKEDEKEELSWDRMVEGVVGFRKRMEREYSEELLRESVTFLGNRTVEEYRNLGKLLVESLKGRRKLVLGVTGGSSTAGAGVGLLQVWPRFVVLQMRKLGFFIAARNAALGMTSTLLTSPCLENTLGRGVDVFLWEFSMNEEVNQYVNTARRPDLLAAHMELFIKAGARLHREKEPGDLKRRTTVTDGPVFLFSYFWTIEYRNDHLMGANPVLNFYGQHFEMIRTSIYPLIREGRVKKNDTLLDTHHPSLMMHQTMANFITYAFAGVFLGELKANQQQGTGDANDERNRLHVSPPIPLPSYVLSSEVYPYPDLISASDMSCLMFPWPQYGVEYARIKDVCTAFPVEKTDFKNNTKNPLSSSSSVVNNPCVENLGRIDLSRVDRQLGRSVPRCVKSQGKGKGKHPPRQSPFLRFMVGPGIRPRMVMMDIAGSASASPLALYFNDTLLVQADRSQLPGPFTMFWMYVANIIMDEATRNRGMESGWKIEVCSESDQPIRVKRIVLVE